MDRILLTTFTLSVLLSVGSSFSQKKLITRDELQKLRQKQIRTKQALLKSQRHIQSLKVSVSQNNYDVKYYKLNLNINPETEIISGFVEMKAQAKTDNFDMVELDLSANMNVDHVGEDAVSYNHTGDILKIQLSEPLQNGESFTIQVAYNGQPSRGGFGAFGFNYHSGEPIIWSLSEPYYARNWWPCKDSPNDKADSVDILLTVPDNLIAASNGILLRNVDNDNGTRTFHWQESYPITTYLVSLAITNYATYSEWFHYTANDSMEVKYFVYPEHLNSAKNQFTETINMLTYFHEIFGPYPFITEKYGIAQFPWGGGMEHQTITSQGSFGVNLTVHELAHQWWGDKITNANWHEIWLNEGFASYSEALFYEHRHGKTSYHSHMNSMDWNHPYAIYVDDTTSNSRIFNGTVYDKGAWFLHMLRHVVGDSTFFDILLAYSHDPRFAYGNTTTAGFQDVCETVSGQNLDWFFQPWIYEEGRPVYQALWRDDDSSGSHFLNLRIMQIQYPQSALFPMPIDITVETTQGDTLISVFNDAAIQDFSILLNAEITDIILDKEGWILKRVDSVTAVDNPFNSVYDFSLQQNYPNPFNSKTVITFSLANSENVELTIYNIRGQQVRKLVSQPYEAGTQRVTWNGLDNHGISLASGLYIYQIQAGEFKQQRKLLFIK